MCLVPETRQELTTEGGLDVLGQEARIREALLLLRQWLMRLYRLPEEKCAQFESSTSATPSALLVPVLWKASER